MATTPSVIAGYTPQVVNSWLTEPYMGIPGAVRYHERGWAGIRAIVIHVQEGNNSGTKQHFRSVLASSTVLIAKSGLIERLVPESKAPWTNGDVNGPDQLAIALMNRYGWDPNTWCLTIENEGYSGGLPYTDAQFKSNVWQVWQWLQDYPTIETAHIMRHGQVNSVTRASCPDPAPHTFFKAVVAAITGSTVPVTPNAPTEIYRPAWPVVSDTGIAWDGLHDLITTNAKGEKTVWHADKRTVTVSVDTLNCRQWASSTANLVRKPVVKGEKISVLGWVEGEEVDGERRWWVSTYGTRLWSGGTAETPAKAAPKPTRPDDGVSRPDYGNNRDAIPVVLNGNTYYPVERKGDKATRTMRFIVNGNVRLWAATHQWSPVQRVQPKGSAVEVSHWVKGESVEGNDKWFVIAEGKDPIRTGGRIWSGLVEPV